MAIISNFPKDIGDVIAMQLDALAFTETFMRCRFDWGDATEMPCAAGPLKVGSELDIGGWKKMQRCKVEMRTVNLPDPTDMPKAKDTITLYLSEDGVGHKLRILSVENRFDAVLTLECVDTNHPQA